MKSKFLASLQRLAAWDDPDLQSYFTKNAAIEELEGFTSQRCLAVGLKGIGKTATFRHLTEFDRAAGRRTADVAVGITQRTYTYFLDNDRVNWATAQTLFEDDLVLEALRAIIAAKLGRKDIAADLKEAGRLLGIYGAALKLAADFLASISEVTILGLGFKRLSPPGGPPTGLQLEAETRKAFEVLRRICTRGVKVRIVIDDPETIFHSGPVLDLQLLGGLFLAALRLSRVIPNFKVVILIKTHIFYPVLAKMEDRDKFPDAMIHLGWRREELLDVLGNRIRWAGGGWSDHVQGDEAQAKELIRTEICANLRNGPRELLRWAELATRTSADGKIDRQSIQASKREMAQFSLEALEAAFSDRYPDLGDVIRCLFRAAPNRELSRLALEKHIGDLLTRDEMMDLRSRLQWLRRLNYKTLPKTLLESGTVSFKLGKDLILPYEDRYDEVHFRKADGVRLTPILADAL